MMQLIFFKGLSYLLSIICQIDYQRINFEFEFHSKKGGILEEFIN